MGRTSVIVLILIGVYPPDDIGLNILRFLSFSPSCCGSFFISSVVEDLLWQVFIFSVNTFSVNSVNIDMQEVNRILIENLYKNQ